MSRVASPPSSTICVGPAAAAEVEGALGQVPVLLERLALPGEDRDALRASPACPRGPPPPRPPRGPGSRRCCTTPSAPRRPAPSASRSRTAVWMVMCRLPVTRWPLSGCCRGVLAARTAIRPGISCSASRISLRPHSASAGPPPGTRARPWPRAAFMVVVIASFSFFASRRIERAGASARPASSSAGPLASGSGGSGRQRTAARPASVHQRLQLVRLEAEARLAHLAAEVLAVVAQQVDHDRAAARAQDARHLAQRRPPGLDVGEGEQQQRAVARAVVDGQRLEAPLPQLDVVEAGRAPPRRLQHGGRLVDADHPRARTARARPPPGRCRSRGRPPPSPRAAARGAPPA